MTVEQRLWQHQHGWRVTREGGNSLPNDAQQLVLAFGEGAALADRFDELRSFYPNARILSCSSAGEILNASVYDHSIAVTALRFATSRFEVASINIADCGGSHDAGARLASSVSHEGLVHLFVLSDGHAVNGSELVRGIASAAPHATTITGGLAGDGTRFAHTVAGLDRQPESGNIVIAAFYGDALQVGFGSVGGWESFGRDRVVTRSRGNVLYELDGQPALDLYKRYLGDRAVDLPASALLFPLSVRDDDSVTVMARTILSIDERNGSMTFAGDMPNGANVRLMMAGLDRLLDGASRAAEQCHETGGTASAEVAILISCVGRRMVLGQRTEEEVESVRGVLGAEPAMTGFYSYGEIAPGAADGRCELHNQTMTVTTLSERGHA